MIFVDKTVGSFLRKFVTEFGVDFDDYVFIIRNFIFFRFWKKNFLFYEFLKINYSLIYRIQS